MRGDPDHIRQMLTNPLANSMRHTPTGSTIVLELMSHEKGVNSASATMVLVFLKPNSLECSCASIASTRAGRPKVQVSV
jgi:signal transduction histidine kinase